jgi:hypothetical protein
MRSLRIPALAAAAFGLMLAFSAQAQDHAPNMHRPQVTGEMSNSEIAASYKAEAAEIRERAATHRKMAEHFKGRNTLGGKLNFSGTIGHCNKLAAQYEAAAIEAEAIAAELSK